MIADEVMTQTAPFPHALAELVASVTYRPGWHVRLIVDAERDFAPDDAAREHAIGRGLTLEILTRTVDSYHPERGENYRVAHWFIVPAATYNRSSWQRWLFDRFVDVERHEAMEFFRIDGDQPFAPNHGPGHDPYTVRELTTDDARRTSFRGVTKEPGA